MAVELAVQAAETSPLVVSCDNDWGGIEHCEREIRGPEAYDAEHHPLGVEQVGSTWRVAAPRGARVTLRYVLSPPRSEGMTEENRYYPVVGDDYLHFIGHVGLLAPREPKGQESRERNIGLHWRGFDEAGWATACSFGTDRDIALRRSLTDFLHAVFVAGDYQLLRAKAAGGDVILAVRPGTWRFGAEDLLATAMPVIEEERRLFRDPPSTLLLTATPMALDADSIHGTMLTDSIALFFPRAGRVMPAPLFGLLVAHELFHNWDTLAMRPSEAEGASIMWFTEGFAEFYMRRIAYRAGRIGRNDYLWHLNRALLEYATSASRDVSNGTVGTDFWKSPAIGRIPYTRGQIVALIVDAQLRRTSRGARSLDDLVRALLGDVRTSGQGVTTEAVLRKIGSLTSPEFESEIRRTVIDGQLPTIPPDAFAPCLRLNESTVEESEGAGRRSVKVSQFEYVPSGQSACIAVL